MQAWPSGSCPRPSGNRACPSGAVRLRGWRGQGHSRGWQVRWRPRCSCCCWQWRECCYCTAGVGSGKRSSRNRAQVLRLRPPGRAELPGRARSGRSSGASSVGELTRVPTLRWRRSDETAPALAGPSLGFHNPLFNVAGSVELVRGLRGRGCGPPRGGAWHPTNP